MNAWVLGFHPSFLRVQISDSWFRETMFIYTIRRTHEAVTETCAPMNPDGTYVITEGRFPHQITLVRNP